MRVLMLAPGLLCIIAARLSAQDTADLLNRIKAMEARIQALESEVQNLKSQPAVVPPAAPILQASTPVVLGGAGPAAAKALNPDISVIGDFIGAAGYGANRKTPSLEMHESEVGFQEVIDPYARADFFIS